MRVRVLALLVVFAVGAIGVVAYRALSGDSKPALDPVIVAWWEANGHALMVDGRTLLPEVAATVQTGMRCAGGTATREDPCDGVAEALRAQVAELRALADRAEASDPPAGRAADWVTAQIAAWHDLASAYEDMAGLAVSGADLAAWQEQSKRQAELTSPTDAELALAAVLIRVPVELRQ